MFAGGGGGGANTTTLAVAFVPSVNLAVRMRLAPDGKRLLLESEAKILKLPPSVTVKFTLPLAALRSDESREAAAPSTHLASPGAVFQRIPLLSPRFSSSCETV